MLDKNNNPIAIHDLVVVNDPEINDMWQHSFAGRIENLKYPYTVVVVDQDDNWWDVDADKVELLPRSFLIE